MEKKTMLRVLLPLLVLLTFCGCMESMVQPEAKIDTGAEMGLGPYSGPRARVAVADFEWKVGGSGSTTKIGFGGQTMTIASSQSRGYTTGLRDMLTTALVQSNRYRVLERQNIDSLKSEMALTGSGYTDTSGVKKVRRQRCRPSGDGSGHRMGTGLIWRRRRFGRRRHAGNGVGIVWRCKRGIQKILDGHGHSYRRYPHLRSPHSHPRGRRGQGCEPWWCAGRIRRQRRNGRRLGRLCKDAHGKSHSYLSLQCDQVYC
jgi:hypothetical protein